jgi:CubicO group peptidase (beta-lactamase class C family)
MEKVDELILGAIADGAFPGACYSVGRAGGAPTLRAFGRYTYCPDSPAVTSDTIWDLASVSKVVGTTTAAMMLFDEGKLVLDQPVAELVDGFGAHGKEGITVRNLMVHDSGLIAFRPFHRSLTQPEQVFQAINEERLEYPTGSKTVYSDLNMILLAKIVEELSGRAFTEFLRQRVFEPLEMKDTGYSPGLGNPRCAPTEGIEPWRSELHRLRRLPRVAPPAHPDLEAYIQGEVHDPAATVLGGPAGHAGLFSTAWDLSRFMSMMLDEGADLIRPETVRLFTRRQGEASSRALGWDTPSGASSAGTRFSRRSFGHTGYTGTSVWGDPERRIYGILLTNRVHPTASNTKIIAFRPKFHDAVFEALTQ